MGAGLSAPIKRLKGEKGMKGTEGLCACCRKIKSQKDFSFGYGAQSKRKLYVCKECCSNKLDKYKDYVGEKGAFWLLCGELGVPFIENVYEIACTALERRLSNPSRASVQPTLFDIYVDRLSKLNTVYNGFWDSDIMLDDLIAKDKGIQSKLEPTRDLSLMQKYWGKFPDDEYNEAYEFLESTFEEYTKDIIDMDANLINRYRDLCKAEYIKRKAQEGGDLGDIAKAQSNVNNLLKLLKLDEFKPNNIDPREKFIDRMAWMIEETEPAELEDREKYRDIAGFEESFREIMRSMRNLIAGTRDYPDIPRDER